MNPDRAVWGRLTINGEQINLGRATFTNLLKRLAEQYAKKKYVGDKLVMTMEVSDEEISFDSLLTREQQIEQEFKSNLRTVDDIPDDEECLPGVTTKRSIEAIQHPLYESMFAICHPSTRVGVDQSTIDSIKSQWAEAFPDIHDKFPVWFK